MDEERDVSKEQTERGRGAAERSVLGKAPGSTVLRLAGFAVLFMAVGLLFVWLA